MALIKRSSIEDVKARVSLYDVVSPTVALRKVGSEWRGLSPFNEEKTPSFYISPDKGLYKCFSSGKAGDIFTFVMETERLNFTEAVETIAERFGIKIEYEEGSGPRESRSLRQELYLIHEIATDYFHEALFAANDAAKETRRYWEENRAFPIELAKEFKIGLAPLDGRELIDRCLKQKVSLEALKNAGLFYQRGSHLSPTALWPRFRGRLMIPIRDHQGRVVAFTARQLEITPADDPARDAKYINSPETPLFNKSALLFGLDRARMEASDENPFLLVEGQLDVLRCWQKGLTTAVAPQGTAITEQQLHLLRRYSSRIDCLLDGDAAGERAALRILPMALKIGLEIRFLVLPKGQDPDNLLAKGTREEWDQIATNPVSAMKFAASLILPNPRKATPQQKAQAAATFFEIIAAAGSEVAQFDYLDEAAHLLQLDRTGARNDFIKYKATKAKRRAPIVAKEISKDSEDGKMLTTAEESLLLLCLHYPELGKPLAERIDPAWLETDSLAGRLLNLTLAEFEHDMWEGPETLEQMLETKDERDFLHSLTFETPDLDNPTTIANEALQYLYKNAIISIIRRIEVEIAGMTETLDAAVISLQRKRSKYRRMLLQPPQL
ncbi:MAG TPA: DNA primase [Opitutales bacterium]|nr:DNA primase [Opitutales bacterium]